MEKQHGGYPLRRRTKKETFLEEQISLQPLLLAAWVTEIAGLRKIDRSSVSLERS